eukprot:scaffold2178_cov171-Alexandrium_tamarense.AAC.10
MALTRIGFNEDGRWYGSEEQTCVELHGDGGGGMDSTQWALIVSVRNNGGAVVVSVSALLLTIRQRQTDRLDPNSGGAFTE